MSRDLDRLACAYGISPRFGDAFGQEREVTPETKRVLLAAMGVDIGTETEAAEALARLQMARWATLLDPATIVDEGGRAVPLRAAGTGRLSWSLTPEGGRPVGGEAMWGDLPLAESVMVDGRPLESRRLVLPVGLPPGYHRLRVEIAGTEAEAAVIAVPHRAWLPETDERAWALAIQLYGLHSERSWGIGDFGDLGSLARLAAGIGADAISISPTHAMFPADPGHFGPYGPSSRLFLNVMHIDVSAIPGFGESPAVMERATQADVQAALKRARIATLVDYPAVAAAKLPVLEASWQWFRRAHAGPAASPLGGAFADFCAEGGEGLADHALFDALHAHFFGADGAWNWRAWPAGFAGPREPEARRFAEENPERIGFYAYLQWLADRQLAAAQETARAAGMAIGLYRDLAVATHPGGAMAWSDPQAILGGAHVGAPPDAFNQLGQDWGLAGLSPMGLRRGGFRTFIRMVRANMRHAGALRIDHVMALDRLFLIPAGGKPADGAYLDYPAEALHGILRLESLRHRCLVVGEDLGTVPTGFRERLTAGGILGYRVFYFERDGRGGFTPPAHLPKDCLLAATTHDLPTLAGYWNGSDIGLRRALGLFADPVEAERAIGQRAADRRALLAWLWDLGLLPEGGEEALAEAIIPAVYAALAQAPSRLLAVPAEDVLGLAEQPNVPGTVDSHPNWQRKLPCPVDDIAGRPLAVAVAAAIRRHRGPGRPA